MLHYILAALEFIVACYCVVQIVVDLIHPIDVIGLFFHLFVLGLMLTLIPINWKGLRK